MVVIAHMRNSAKDLFGREGLPHGSSLRDRMGCRKAGDQIVNYACDERGMKLGERVCARSTRKPLALSGVS